MFFKRFLEWIKNTYHKMCDWFKEHFKRTEVERAEMEENIVNEITQLLHKTEQPSQSLQNNPLNLFGRVLEKFLGIRHVVFLIL